ncbi:hypothetical protein TNCV_1843811 [Trichonephila clavipes]|nr:hypothetical protein TNCV_1843811 [Trichonephila clavipes]
MRGTLTGERYVDDILRPHIEPPHAHPHAARVAQDFLRHFQTLPWPARPPRFVPCRARVGLAKTADAIVSLCT